MVHLYLGSVGHYPESTMVPEPQCFPVLYGVYRSRLMLMGARLIHLSIGRKHEPYPEYICI